MSRIRDSGDELIRVEPTLSADAERIRDIATQCGIDAWTVAHYQDEATNPESLFLKALNDLDTIVGFVSGRVVGGASSESDGEIYGIAVSSENRGQGIGRYLLENAIDWFNSVGGRSIWLEVRASNNNAIQFYENNGFIRAGIRKNFYAQPAEDAIVMKLTLGVDTDKTNG